MRAPRALAFSPGELQRGIRDAAGKRPRVSSWLKAREWLEESHRRQGKEETSMNSVCPRPLGIPFVPAISRALDNQRPPAPSLPPGKQSRSGRCLGTSSAECIASVPSTIHEPGSFPVLPCCQLGSQMKAGTFHQKPVGGAMERSAWQRGQHERRELRPGLQVPTCGHRSTFSDHYPPKTYATPLVPAQRLAPDRRVRVPRGVGRYLSRCR